MSVSLASTYCTTSVFSSTSSRSWKPPLVRLHQVLNDDNRPADIDLNGLTSLLASMAEVGERIKKKQQKGAEDERTALERISNQFKKNEAFETQVLPKLLDRFKMLARDLIEAVKTRTSSWQPPIDLGKSDGRIGSKGEDLIDLLNQALLDVDPDNELRSAGSQLSRIPTHFPWLSEASCTSIKEIATTHHRFISNLTRLTNEDG